MPKRLTRPLVSTLLASYSEFRVQKPESIVSMFDSNVSKFDPNVSMFGSIVSQCRVRSRMTGSIVLKSVSDMPSAC